MTKNVFTSPLVLIPKVTMQSWMLILIPHFLILLFVIITPVELYIVKVLLSLVIILSLYYFLRLYIFKNLDKSIESFSKDSMGNWYIQDVRNQQHPVQLLPSSFVSKFLIILNYAGIDKNKFSVLITRDSLEDDEFRRLKIRLK